MSVTVDKFGYLVFLRLSNPLSIQWKSYMGHWAADFLCLCNWVDGWLLRLAMVTPATEPWAQKAATLISHLTAEWRCSVDIFRELCNGFPRSHLVSVCLGVGRHPGKDGWGLGSCLPVGARATSPPQVPRSEPLRQDWTVSDLWLPLPLPNICCSSQGWLSRSSHGRCLAAPFSFLLKVFALWPGDCLRNAPVTLKINKSCVFSHDPWGQRRIPLVGLDFPFGNTGHLPVLLHF